MFANIKNDCILCITIKENNTMQKLTYQQISFRINRLNRLRNIAIEQRNLFKKKQADYLLNLIVPKQNHLTFSIN